MAPRPQDLVDGLGAYDQCVKLRSVRGLKNEIVGSKHKKMLFIKMGAVPRVVEILARESESGLLVQSAATVGSFAYGMDDGVVAILDSGGMSHLLKTLQSKDDKVVEAGVRSLKMIFQSMRAPKDQIFADPALERLVALLSSGKRTFSQMSASVLARCCHTAQQQELLLQAGALHGLLQLLKSPYKSCQQSALDALAALSMRNDEVCQQVMQHPGVDDELVRFTKNRSPSIRLLACSCLTNLACSSDWDNMEGEMKHRYKHVLQVLVKLLNEPTIREQVPEVLSRLTEASQELQSAAHEADAVRRLCSFLLEPSSSAKMRQGTLKALGTLCMELAECRTQVIDSKAINPIVAALEDPIADVRAAAAFCIRGMTRSVVDLKADWINASTTTPLLKLLSDSDSEVQEVACSTLCNLVMAFTRVKEVLMDQGLSQIVDLTQSMEPKLRQSAAWALKNLAYEADVGMKKRMLDELPWSYVRSLLDDSESGVQEHTLRFLQNLCNAEHGVVQLVMDWSGSELVGIVAQKLEKERDSPLPVVAAALRVAANISTGLPAHQDAVMDSGIPRHLLTCLRETRSEEVRVAAVWSIINLTWRDELPLGVGTDQAKTRARALVDIGVKDALMGMTDDSSLDVRERVQTALGFFRDLDT